MDIRVWYLGVHAGERVDRLHHLMVLLCIIYARLPRYNRLNQIA